MFNRAMKLVDKLLKDKSFDAVDIVLELNEKFPGLKPAELDKIVKMIVQKVGAK